MRKIIKKVMSKTNTSNQPKLLKANKHQIK